MLDDYWRNLDSQTSSSALHSYYSTLYSAVRVEASGICHPTGCS
jgi:hypothetical protein